MKYRIDAMSLRDGTLMIEGWAMPQKSYEIRYSVTDQKGKPVKYTCVARDRVDVAQQFGADRMCGFTVAVPFDREDEIYLVMQDGEQKRRVKVNAKTVEKRNSIKAKRTEKLLALCHFETLVVSYDFVRENGLRAFWKKAVHKIQKIDEDYDYAEWEYKTKLSEEELFKQKDAWKAFSFPNGKAPLFSIVIPAYNTPERYLSMLFDSLKAQTYPNFEVIVADGSDQGNTSVKETTERYREDDARFCYVPLSKNLGISENTNAGLKAATGDYIVLCDHDDELPANAFYEVAKAISEHPHAAFLYTDEDKIDFDGKALFEPHFKSDFNMELLTSVNYVCHLSVIKRELLEKVGGFRTEFDGAQDHDFFFRCMEEAAREEREALSRYYEAVKALGYDRVMKTLKQTDAAGAELVQTDTSGTFDALCGSADTANSHLEKEGESSQEGGQHKDSESQRILQQLMEASGFSEDSLRSIAEGRFTSERIIHIPVICYHWRFHKGSTASDPKAKLYAFEAGSRAVMAHYERMGLPAASVEKGVTYGYYHTSFTDKNGNPMPALYGKDGKLPKVSVLIPNKDHTEDLDKVLRSLIQRSNYRNLELIVIENNSTEEKTFAYYQQIDGNPAYFLQNAAAKADTNQPAEENRAVSDISDISIKVVYWEREFNYSAINNFGRAAASGAYILLLNNDVELQNPDAITEMVAYISRPEVGIVGARLMYGDDTIQHAGVIVGLGGIAGAAFVGLHEKENSYMHRMMCVQDYSAVTAACLMTKREVFDTVGGLTEALAVAFNDIDYCMKVRSLGLLCVYDPYVSFYHYESKSRGLEDTPEKVQRFNGEIATFASLWGEILKKGDPYYNPNLTLRKANFALKDLMKEKIGEPYKLELDIEKQLKVVLLEKERREKLQKSTKN